MYRFAVFDSVFRNLRTCYKLNVLLDIREYIRHFHVEETSDEDDEEGRCEGYSSYGGRTVGVFGGWGHCDGRAGWGWQSISVFTPNGLPKQLTVVTVPFKKRLVLGLPRQYSWPD